MKLKNKIIGLLSFALIAVGLSSVPASALGTPKVQQVVSWRWVDGPASETGAAFLQKAGAVCEIPVVPGYNGFASNQPDDWGSGEDHASLWGGPEWNDANNTINPYPFVFEIGN